MDVKAVALLSGGLDSSLAVRVVQEQGVEVEGIHFVSVFNGSAPATPTVLRPLRVARQLGIRFHAVNFTREQLGLVRHPAHGYGANMNPCIDCHMAMLRRAAKIMEDVGARFIVTGEVVGQRPMSQRRHVLGQINRETGLDGLILRPLSAKLLPPSIAEKEGWVDRERLLDIQGRSRKRQLALAAEWGITEHASPAGGCLLTDPRFSARLRDLLDAVGDGCLDLFDVHLLKVGRHFRLDDCTQAIVGRNERENATLYTFSRPGDRLLMVRDVPGPTTLLRGDVGDENLRLAAGLTARSSKLLEAPSVAVEVRLGRTRHTEPPTAVVDTAPLSDDEADRLRV